MHARLLLAALPSLTLISACPGPYSVDGYGDHMVNMQCKFYYQCCNAAERIEMLGSTMIYLGVHNTEEECREEWGKLISMSMAPYQESVAKGRGEWNAERAQTCAQALEEGANRCDAEQLYEGSEGEACGIGDIFTGSVAGGGSCYFDAECAGQDAICETRTADNPDQTLRTYEGTCEAPPSPGQPCNERSCAQGAYCDDNDTCQATKPEGQPCDYSEECQSYRCNYDGASGEYLCAALLGNGESCYSDYECQSDYCDANSGLCAPSNGPTEQTVIYDMCKGDGFAILGYQLAVDDDALASWPE